VKVNLCYLTKLHILLKPQLGNFNRHFSSSFLSDSIIGNFSVRNICFCNFWQNGISCWSNVCEIGFSVMQTSTSEVTIKREKVFVIVAYRDREEHKQVFVSEMNTYLTKKAKRCDLMTVLFNGLLASKICH